MVSRLIVRDPKDASEQVLSERAREQAIELYIIADSDGA